MSSDLFFALTRISAAQVLRAAGLDRCAPSVLNTFTDLIIKHLQLLTVNGLELAQLCGRDYLMVSDIRMSMEKCGMLRPYSIDADSFDYKKRRQFFECAVYEQALREKEAESTLNSTTTTAPQDGGELVSDESFQDLITSSTSTVNDNVEADIAFLESLVPNSGIGPDLFPNEDGDDDNGYLIEQEERDKQDLQGVEKFLVWGRDSIRPDSIIEMISQPAYATAPTSAAAANAAILAASGNGDNQQQPTTHQQQLPNWLSYLMEKQVKVGQLQQERFKGTVLGPPAEQRPKKNTNNNNNNNNNNSNTGLPPGREGLLIGGALNSYLGLDL